MFSGAKSVSDHLTSHDSQTVTIIIQYLTASSTYLFKLAGQRVIKLFDYVAENKKEIEMLTT